VQKELLDHKKCYNKHTYNHNGIIFVDNILLFLFYNFFNQVSENCSSKAVSIIFHPIHSVKPTKTLRIIANKAITEGPLNV